MYTYIHTYMLKAALEKAASLVPLGQLFGADVMERYLKV